MKQTQLILVFLFLGLFVTVAHAEKSVTEQLEEKYFQTLDGWVKRGGPANEVQDTVVQTCGKLVMLTVSSSERVALSTIQREQFHYRVDVCTKITVNRVHPQPEFEKKEIIRIICDESTVSLFKKLCKRYGLR
jgi:hypothetical protein